MLTQRNCCRNIIKIMNEGITALLHPQVDDALDFVLWLYRYITQGDNNRNPSDVMYTWFKLCVSTIEEIIDLIMMEVSHIRCMRRPSESCAGNGNGNGNGNGIDRPNLSLPRTRCGFCLFRGIGALFVLLRSNMPPRRC